MEEKQIDAMLLESTISEDLNHQKALKHSRLLASEICLFCNLYDLFTKYSISDTGPASENDMD